MCCKGRVSSFDEYEIGDRFQTVVISWMTVSYTELLKALVAAERDERVLFALGVGAAVLLRFLLRYHVRCAVALYVPLYLCVVIYTSSSLCDVLHAEGALWQTAQNCSLQCSHLNGKKSSWLHDSSLQCSPIDKKSTPSTIFSIVSLPVNFFSLPSLVKTKSIFIFLVFPCSKY